MTTTPTFAVAVTTAPRRTPTLRQTLASIEAAGFHEPLVSCEPDTESDGPMPCSVLATVNPGPAGPWPNLLNALRLLLAVEPSATAYCVFQDDISLPRGLAPWLAAQPVLFSRNCIISLFTCAATAWELPLSGWSKIYDLRRASRGAQAYIFPAHIARDFAAHPPDSAGKVTGADLWVARWLRSRSLPLWLHSPSLCQHTAPDASDSSLEHPAGVLNCRQASAWVSDCEAWERTGGREGIEYQAGADEAAKAAIPAGS